MLLLKLMVASSLVVVVDRENQTIPRTFTDPAVQLCPEALLLSKVTDALKSAVVAEDQSTPLTYTDPAEVQLSAAALFPLMLIDESCEA